MDELIKCPDCGCIVDENGVCDCPEPNEFDAGAYEDHYRGDR